MKQYLKQFNKAFTSVSQSSLDEFISLLKQKRRVYLIGNGGSSAIASHFANDLIKIGGIEAICLSDNIPTLTAYANDMGYHCVYSEQIKNFMHPPDILVAISSSGNSPNILKAIKEAKRLGLKTIGFVGFKGGKFKPDIKIYVKSNDYGIVESVHETLAHYIISMVK